MPPCVVVVTHALHIVDVVSVSQPCAKDRTSIQRTTFFCMRWLSTSPVQPIYPAVVRCVCCAVCFSKQVTTHNSSCTNVILRSTILSNNNEVYYYQIYDTQYDSKPLFANNTSLVYQANRVVTHGADRNPAKHERNYCQADNKKTRTVCSVCRLYNRVDRYYLAEATLTG